jgi:signal transduction histidine kinase
VKPARTGPWLAAATASVIVVFASVAGAFVAYLFGVALEQALIASIMTGLVAAGVAFAALDMLDRRQSSARASLWAPVERLMDLLAHATTREDVTDVVERTVRSSLRCDHVSFTAWPHADQAPEPDAGASGPTIRIRCMLHGQPVALLQVRAAPDRGFTWYEVDLLRTLANHATLSLAYLERMNVLDRRRREQADAWENERAAVIEALAAEIAHEVRYPVNFFRSVFTQERPAGLEPEEVDIGCEEVERLERLVTDLRRVAVRHLERKEVPIVDIVVRAERLLRDRLDGRTFDVTVPSSVRVRCDPDQVTQVLVNLMSNAVSATKTGAAIGVDWSTTDAGAHLVVWDCGEGFVCPPAIIFTPWFTTKSTGTGLGLAITHRIVRAHGWSVDASREDQRTRFLVFIPSSDIVSATESAQGTEENGDDALEVQ